MMIVTNDGLTIEGTPETIVEHLARTSQTETASLSAFMRDVATRVMLWNRTPIRTRDAGKFLYDLQDAGLILIDD